MRDDFSSRDCIAILLLIVAIFATGLMVILKLCHVIIFTWWLVFSPIYAAVVTLVIWVIDSLKSYGK